MSSITTAVVTSEPPQQPQVNNNQNKQVFDQDGFLVLRKVLPPELLIEWQDYGKNLFQYTFQRLYENGHTSFPTHCRRRQRNGAGICLTASNPQKETIQSRENQTLATISDADPTIKIPNSDDVPLENGHKVSPSSSSSAEEETSDDDDDDAASEETSIEYAMGLGLRNGFAEIVMRSPGRYELSLLNGTNGDDDDNGGQCPSQQSPRQVYPRRPSLSPLWKHLAEIIPPLLNAPPGCSCGLDTGTTDRAGDSDDKHHDGIHLASFSFVLSTPGSPDQAWHADGGHLSSTHHLPCHCLNVFVPLVDVPLELGPTQFRPGTQVHTRRLGPMLLAAQARKTLRAPVTPTLQRGDVLVFDYRVLHRGLANRGSSHSSGVGQHGEGDRWVLVLTLAKSWFHDVLNFPRKSFKDERQKQTGDGNDNGCQDDEDAMIRQ